MRSFCVEFGFKHIHVRLIGHFKWIEEWKLVCLIVLPLIQPVDLSRLHPASRPMTAGIGSMVEQIMAPSPLQPPGTWEGSDMFHLRNYLSPEREMFFHATHELLYSIVTSRWRQSLSKTSALRPLTFSLHNTEKSPLKTPECTAAEQLLIICGFHKKWKRRFLSFPSLNIHFMAHKLCKMTEVPLKSEPPLRLFPSPLCGFYPQLTFMRSLYSENLPNLLFSLMF